MWVTRFKEGRSEPESASFSSTWESFWRSRGATGTFDDLFKAGSWLLQFKSLGTIDLPSHRKAEQN
jgi:hypothetical protein